MSYVDYEGGYGPKVELHYNIDTRGASDPAATEKAVRDAFKGVLRGLSGTQTIEFPFTADDSQPDGFKGILNDLANQYPGTTDYVDIDDEIEEELDSDDDVDLDTIELSPVVSVDSDGDIVLRLQNGAHVLSPEEAEEVISKLSWALDSVFALSERVPF